MTADEFIKYCDSLENNAQFQTRLKSYKQYNTCRFLMEKYAQLKCKELLDIVAEKAEVKTVTIPSGLNIKTCVVDTDSILNCVNLENFCK